MKIRVHTFWIILISIIYGNCVSAAVNESLITKSSNYMQIASELVDAGMYFSAVPFVKYYLVSNNVSGGKGIDDTIDQIAGNVGGKQFEVLPENILSRSGAPTLRYILAKKYFRQRKYNQALLALNAVSDDHAMAPFKRNMKGVIYNIKKDYKNALIEFKICISVSQRAINSTGNIRVRQRQLHINRDSCLVNMARTQFAKGDFEAANSIYLDLSKRSIVWPEILFEEAWNSFYMRNFNRTLGKLVTYKAPILSYIFNPEIEVLKAMTYLELCLWDDAKNAVDNFYKEFQKDAISLENFVAKAGKNYKLYYLYAKDRQTKNVDDGRFIDKLLKDITRDPAYLEMYESFIQGRDELQKIKQLKSREAQRVLAQSLKETLVLQRDLIGVYVKNKLKNFDIKMLKSFEDMSYIKLEVLGLHKRELYQNMSIGRDRGSISNLERNEKQYFWTFNGEFWADELGDYVFALKSECRE